MFKPRIRHALVGVSLAMLLGVAAASAVNDPLPRGTVSVQFLGTVDPAELIPEVMVVAPRLPSTIRLAQQARSVGTALLQ